MIMLLLHRREPGLLNRAVDRPRNERAPKEEDQQAKTQTSANSDEDSAFWYGGCLHKRLFRDRGDFELGGDATGEVAVSVDCDCDIEFVTGAAGSVGLFRGGRGG